jgi:hypothetical protein
MQSISSESDPAAWNQIAPLLDEALNCLEEREHDAVVLRFFDGKQLKQVGAEMGTTEDAARMRVNRGLEKLRKFFMKKGVTLSATGISGAVAANSIQAAPAGLAATITTAALSGTALTTTAAIAASKAMGMTALLKAIIATAFAVGVVTGIYEARQAANARAELHTVQQQQAPLTGQIQQLLRDRDDLASKLDAQRGENEQLNRNTAELLKLRNEVGRLRSEARVSPPASVNAAAERFVARVNNLKQYVEQNPSEAVPEFQLIADQDWYSAGDSTLDRANSVKPEDYRRALYSLRGAAESRFGDCVRRALYKYRSANNGQFPDALSQLSPFCDPATMEPILQLYEIRTADTLPEDFLKQVRHVKADRFITRTEPINPNGWTRCAIFSDTCLCWSTPP